MIVYTSDNPWVLLFESLDHFSDNFMNERNQPPQQIREDIFD